MATNWTKCRKCKRSREELGYLSQRGLCKDCGMENMLDNVHQMHNHEGPNYEKWLRASLATLERKLGSREP